MIDIDTYCSIEWNQIYYVNPDIYQGGPSFGECYFFF